MFHIDSRAALNDRDLDLKGGGGGGGGGGWGGGRASLSWTGYISPNYKLRE